MNTSSVHDALAALLKDARVTTAQLASSFDSAQFNALQSNYLTSDIDPPSKCPHTNCDASCTSTIMDDQISIICDLEERPHEFTRDVDEYKYFRLNFEAVMEYIVTIAGYTIDPETFQDDSPRRVAVKTTDGLKIVLLIDLSDPTRHVTEVYIDALQNDQPTLLVTPQENVSRLVEMQSLFALGSLVFTIPFSILDDEREHITRPVETMFSIKDLEAAYLEQQFENEPDPLITRVNSNPRYVLAELNHMRLLRVNKELPQSSGKRLEKAMAAGLSSLFPTTLSGGGEDGRGSDIPDKLFYIPHGGNRDAIRRESILGIVDSKSGVNAKFGSEEAEGKHDEYLDAARFENISYDRLAHTFVILDFDGKQELEFYDKMEPYYKDGDFLLIITADALTLLLSAYLAVNVSNEVQQIYGSFREAVYSLFNIAAFNEKEYENRYREVGQNQPRYNNRYDARDMVILHRAVVKEHLENCLEAPKPIEDIFEDYFGEKPTV